MTLSFLILFLIAALRYGIGTDYWFRYAPLFEQIQHGDVNGQEPGYVLLNKAVGLITDDYQGIFVVTSFLTIALFYRFFLRMSINPALSVFIYAFGGFYLEDFNLVKQGLAIAILVNTFEFALRKKHLAFVLATLLAASFHASALAWFAVWPLMWIRVGRAARIVIALAMILAILLVPQTVSLLVEQFAPSYAWYFDSNYGATRSIHPAVVTVALAALAFTLVKVGKAGKVGSADRFEDSVVKVPAVSAEVLVATKVGKAGSADRYADSEVKVPAVSAEVLVATKVGKAGSADRYADSVVNVLAVSTAVLVATTTIAYLFSRLDYYFAPAQLVAVPLALSLVRNRLARHLLTVAFMSAYMTSFVFQFLVWNAHGVLPYDSIFSR
ncbi:EpsG family protein [Arthrobacter sp. MI7-26]|uniref:EpsG family protein n=1 Tax=Arthrobacter sp. MI7-26 TaxID=2993653 RepID=UPI0022497A0D|nr:EpsG family protein [Arthrobacter sp. MI7-26]MCX2747050.1 EpsG family protein [Arthrobacter sp. MI7-26]